MRPLAPGIAGRHLFVPASRDTAAAIGNEGVVVAATAVLIASLEEASHRGVQPFYEPGEATVGTRVAVEHVGAALPGRPVVSTGTLVAVAGRRLRFAVSAEQDGRVVMRGEHERAVVVLERFLAGLPHPTPTGEALSFWFDFHSPWSYLASLRIETIAAAHGLGLDWRPLHLPKLNAAIGGRQPLQENAAFVRWYKQDLQDWAALQGVEVRYHPDFPLRPARALRAAAFAADQGMAGAFVRRVMRAYWTENLDISDLAVLARLGAEAGLDGDAVAAAAGADAYKRRIAANTAEAVAAGIFGVPSVVFRDRIYFGNDRLDLLDRHLADRVSR